MKAIDLTSALPQRFEFYHLGEVELMEVNEPISDATAVGFRLYGDLSALVIVLFPRALDISTYSELGNVIASRMATQLNTQNGIEVMVSPPQSIGENQLKQIIQRVNPITRRTYAHFYMDSVIPVETLVLPTPSEGLGYA